MSRILSQRCSAALHRASHQPTHALSTFDLAHTQSLHVALSLTHLDAIALTNDRSDAITVALTIAHSLRAVRAAELQSIKDTLVDPYDRSLASAEQITHQNTEQSAIDAVDATDAQSIALSDHGATIDGSDARADAKSDAVSDQRTDRGTDHGDTDHKPDVADDKSYKFAIDGESHGDTLSVAHQNTHELSVEIAIALTVANSFKDTNEITIAHSNDAAEHIALANSLCFAEHIAVEIAVGVAIAHSIDVTDAASERIAIESTDAPSEHIADA